MMATTKISVADAGCEQAGAAVETPPFNTASIYLPLPVSANRLWRYAKKTVVKSGAYSDWIATTMRIIRTNHLPEFHGHYALDAIFPNSMRIDLDNAIKPLNDIFQRACVTKNDKLCRAIHLSYGDVPKGQCLVTLTSLQTETETEKGN
jgi:Holliday junction resolvase RusA-like endonuclease